MAAAGTRIWAAENHTGADETPFRPVSAHFSPLARRWARVLRPCSMVWGQSHQTSGLRVQGRDFGWEVRETDSFYGKMVKLVSYCGNYFVCCCCIYYFVMKYSWSLSCPDPGCLFSSSSTLFRLPSSRPQPTPTTAIDTGFIAHALDCTSCLHFS